VPTLEPELSSLAHAAEYYEVFYKKLAPWSRGFIEVLIIVRIINNFNEFHGTRRMFIKVYYALHKSPPFVSHVSQIYPVHIFQCGL
jgi:hypothetical protein